MTIQANSLSTNELTTNARLLYLDLMKRVLLNTTYGDAEHIPIIPQSSQEQDLLDRGKRTGLLLVRERMVDMPSRLEGREWPQPQHVHSMMGQKRLDNLQHCVFDVLNKGVPGDLIETGVWRGGGTIFMRSILKAFNVTDRTVWVADSFKGLPPPDSVKYPADAGDTHFQLPDLSVSKEKVKINFEKYGLLDDQVRFLEGWFSETLSKAPIKQLAVMRLDGDMYESTTDALIALYPKLSPGGYVIVDDFGYLESCKKAVLDFRKSRNISEPIQIIDWTGVYWQRR